MESIINIDTLCNDFLTKNVITKKEEKEETEIVKQVNVEKEIERVIERVIDIKSERKEVQAHGFNLEKDLLVNVYKATLNELKEIKYNSKMDLPAKLNRLDVCDISVKTSCTPNAVCMADCLRMFDYVSSGNPIHMVVIHYIQDDITNTKKINSIIEIDLTSSHTLLFGELTRSQLEELDKSVKLTGANEVNVNLTFDPKGLQEVVVTALGIKKEAKRLGYATATVSGEALSTNRTANPMSTLQGKLAGVNISTMGTGPGGSTKIRIRWTQR